ncbi:thioredoxin domain-containing protein [Streptomyces sp. NPDC051940]|uniref:thioredoxin domain-containing protein n=1 Tax=Streptomyces sp. NPDC051940 TaxID=3155675 RepID=UPI003431A949
MTPANTTDTDNTTLYYGDPKAAHVLQVFLELRDRGSARMAATLLDTMRQAADGGGLVIKFHFASLIDHTVGGSGSQRALSALAAASDAGQRQYLDYLAALFAHQPFPPGEDKFADTSVLLSLAGPVSGLRSDDFDRKVTDGTYMEWAGQSIGTFESFGTIGTPDLWYDNEQIPVVNIDGDLTLTAPDLAAQIKPASST